LISDEEGRDAKRWPFYRSTQEQLCHSRQLAAVHVDSTLADAAQGETALDDQDKNGGGAEDYEVVGAKLPGENRGDNDVQK
jgi:hypothetical protein